MNAAIKISFVIVSLFFSTSLFTRIFSEHTCDYVSPEQTTYSTLWGILLAFSSSLINSGAYFLLKKTLNANENYCGSVYWWIGFTFLIISEFMTAFAYGFAPAIVVSSLGGLTIVVNTFLAILFLKEKLSLYNILGSISILVGLTLVFIGIPTESSSIDIHQLKNFYGSLQTTLYIFVSGFISTLLYFSENRGILRYSVLAALISSWGIISARGLIYYALSVSKLCSKCGCESVFGDWLLWLLAGITVFSGVIGSGIFEQEGLQKFDQVKWAPVHFCSCTIVFTFSNFVVYMDTIDNTLILLYGVFLAIWGAGLISFT